MKYRNKIELSDDLSAILRPGNVTIRDKPESGLQRHITVSYVDLANILEAAYQPSDIPDDIR